MSIDLDSAIELLEKSERWRAFGQKLSIVSYADVVHCRFEDGREQRNLLRPTLPFACKAGPVSFVLIRREQRDAFLFPYGSVQLWGFDTGQEPTTPPRPPARTHTHTHTHAHTHIHTHTHA